MYKVQTPILIPSVKSDIADHAEIPQVASHDGIGDNEVEIRDLISGPDVSLCVSTFPTTSNKCIPIPENRITTALGKQELVLDSLEDQWSFLEAQALENYAIDCVFSNNRHFRRRSRYSSIQQRFLD
ncbi:hypothetical protein AYI69_g10651 [Smittium culicis]|uniref:Uncharacterized protein n=1 Tax=Smittium culicis TaxID=133412 RepID=A0A1R1X4A2_9FUNG|nr:hypothetical protein AYI69_g10651 [Smittium culicis]